ncbi:MAG: hypothetical protein KAS32_24575, partial [Candidatus Peribacteraceae bacterium]|nr:hypothetical protein [Candidatus Peribacteraceae bacterium]
SGQFAEERYAEPEKMGVSTYTVILYAMVSIFALSWLFGTILIHTTSSKYSLAGTIIGPVTGVLLLEKYGLWLAIRPFLIAGVLSDYLVFRMYSSSLGKGKGSGRRKRR